MNKYGWSMMWHNMVQVFPLKWHVIKSHATCHMSFLRICTYILCGITNVCTKSTHDIYAHASYGDSNIYSPKHFFDNWLALFNFIGSKNLNPPKDVCAHATYGDSKLYSLQLFFDNWLASFTSISSKNINPQRMGELVVFSRVAALQKLLKLQQVDEW